VGGWEGGWGIGVVGYKNTVVYVYLSLYIHIRLSSFNSPYREADISSVSFRYPSLMRVELQGDTPPVSFRYASGILPVCGQNLLSAT
jgi:hypothetical protein